MKALVLSDSHENFDSIVRAVEREKNIDMIIHAGDVNRDVLRIQERWDRIPCAYVIGNNDILVREPMQRTFTFGGRKVFLTHGHLLGVKNSLLRLELAAREEGADICIFGHTHSAYSELKDGMWILNPGASPRTYGIIEVNNNRDIKIEIKENGI